MYPRAKSKDYYTEEELDRLQEQWFKDKERIDQEMKGIYYPYDANQEYKRCLNNKRLQKLFGHAAYLMRGIQEGDMIIYPNEEEIISKVYYGILKNGYFTVSKKYEKKISSWLGKAVSRQTYRRRYGK